MSDIKFDAKKAAYYEEFARKAVFGYDQLFLMVLSVIMENHNEQADVLVVGSGTGMELTTFGKFMPHWRLTGVDPSEEMINITKAKIEGLGWRDRVTLHQGYVESLSEKIYDAATLIYVMRFIANTEKKLSLFQDIGRRLLSGATLVIVDQYGDPSSREFQPMVKAWKQFIKLQGASSELSHTIAEQAVGQSFIDERELQEILTETGFGTMHRFYTSFFHGGWVVRKK